MATVTYAKTSPYAITPQNSWRIGLYVDRPIPADPSDGYFQLGAKYNFRPDTLSYDVYGTPEYWWVFMRRNLDQIRDPIFDVVTGMNIYIPTLARLNSLGY